MQIPAIPYEQLEELDDAGQVQFILDAVKDSGVQIPGGIIEHQRTSYLDNRAIDTAVIEPYDGHVTLYMADRYHDDAITFEPRYATRKPDGGWGEFVSELEVVPIGGEHIQAIDEPYIAKVGAHMSEAIDRIQAECREGKLGPMTADAEAPPTKPAVTTAEKLAELREKLERATEPGGEKAVAKRARRAFPARGRGSIRCWTQALSWRSAHWRRPRVTRTRSTATASSPGTAPSTVVRSVCSVMTRRCSRVPSARCSAARWPG